jgi:hypothetical protein
VVKGLTSPFQVAYVDGSGNTIQLDSVQTNMWTATTTADRGDVVYLYLRYRDDIGIGSNFQFRILINGKVYKEAFGKDKDWATDPTFTFPYQIIRQGICSILGEDVHDKIISYDMASHLQKKESL